LQQTFKHPISLQYTQLENDYYRGSAKLQAFSYEISGLNEAWMKNINEVKNIDLLGQNTVETAAPVQSAGLPKWRQWQILLPSLANNAQSLHSR
jgi:hypothetical protein